MRELIFVRINFRYILIICDTESKQKISKHFKGENEFTRKLEPFLYFIYIFFYTFLKTCIATSLLNYVPCMLKTCSPANVLCVITFSGANVSCVLPCSRANVPCWLTCSCANVLWMLIYSRVNLACELTWPCANMPWVPCLTRLAWPRDHLLTSFTYSDTTFFQFRCPCCWSCTHCW